MKNLLLGATAALSLAALAPAANANNITVCGFDGTTQLCNTGGSPVNFNNSIGAWTAVGSAIGTPPADPGSLLSNTTDFHTTTATGATFILWVTETDLTGPLGNVSWFSSLTTNQLHLGITSVTETTSLQTDNHVVDSTHAIGTVLDTHNFTTSNDAQTLTTIANPGAGPYSITETFVVHATGVGDANLTIDLNGTAPAVPEPASLAILGVGLLGLGFVASRKRS